MFDWLTELILPTEKPSVIQSLITIMLTVGVGIFAGRVRTGKIAFGVSAVLFTGIILGHYGYRINGEILHFMRDFGLILFVYAIGIQVGPSFFSSLKNEGMKYNLLAVSGVLLGGVVTVILYFTTGLSIENLTGIMSGAVTNTPGLGAAKNTITELKEQFPDKNFSDPAIGYAITYPLGVFGIIGSIIVSKLLFKINPVDELKKFRLKRINLEEPLIHEKMRVTNPVFINRTIQSVIEELSLKVVISRIKHAGNELVTSPKTDTVLQEKDVLMVVGQKKDVEDFIKKVGRPSKDSFIESQSHIKIKHLYVTRKSAVHKTLDSLDLYDKYDITVTRVIRAGKEMIPMPSLVLFFGDTLRIAGTEEGIRAAEKIIGNVEKKLEEPDFLSLFGGLLIGILLGSVPIVIPGLPIPVKLGFAAGPLIAALLISRYGGIAFIHSYINTGATHFMKELGICLFFATVGIHAGENFIDNFVQNNGWLWLIYGSLITFIPILFIIIIGHYVMKINFLQLSGILSGSYTDPAALAFSTNYLGNEVPVQSYAQVYPLVTIFRIFTASIIILLFS